MTVRFLTAWNGHQPGDVATLAGGLETSLIAGHLARNNTENDSTPAPDYTGDIAAINAVLAHVATAYANDAAAAIGGVPVGGFYSTAGAVKVRLA